MKIQNVNLEYNVFYLDFNTKKPVFINILNGIQDDIVAHIKSSKKSYLHIHDRYTLMEYLKREFMYHYWCKCEYEYCISSLWEEDFEKAEKHDVWFQIEKNLPMITDYIIQKMNLKY